MTLVDIMNDIADKEVNDPAFGNLANYRTSLIPDLGVTQAQELQSKLAHAQDALTKYNNTVTAGATPDILAIFKNIKDHAADEFKKAGALNTGMAFNLSNADFMNYLNTMNAAGTDPLIPIKNRYQYVQQLAGSTFAAVTNK